MHRCTGPDACRVVAGAGLGGYHGVNEGVTQRQIDVLAAQRVAPRLRARRGGLRLCGPADGSLRS